MKQLPTAKTMQKRVAKALTNREQEKKDFEASIREEVMNPIIARIEKYSTLGEAHIWCCGSGISYLTDAEWEFLKSKGYRPYQIGESIGIDWREEK